jgi:hypothetical protein
MTAMVSRPLLHTGIRGSEVALVQKCLQCGIDGQFGNITETAVMQYQSINKLQVDGWVGDGTWAALAHDFELPPYPPPPLDEMTEAQFREIIDIAGDSELASYSWRDRGRAPLAYVRGMAFAYATLLRKHMAGYPTAIITAQKDSDDESRDALTWYADEFSDRDMDNSRNGIATMRHLFVLQIGLGMRESSGVHCCGRDHSATNTSSETAEAGLFQASWNFSSCTTDIEKLFREYSAMPEGSQQTAIKIFEDDVSCSSSDWACYGSGIGREYQLLAKTCPQFACESVALGLRYLRQHWGPINRHEAELRPEAEDMLLEVQNIFVPSA